MHIRSVVAAWLALIAVSMPALAQETVVPIPLQRAAIVKIKDRSLSVIRRLAREGDSESLAKAAKEMLDELNLVKFHADCCDYKNDYFLLVFAAPDATGASQAVSILIHNPMPDSTEMPGVYGKNGDRLFEIFLSDPDDPVALQSTYTVTHEENPAEKQLGDFANTVVGKLAFPVATIPAAGKTGAPLSPPPPPPRNDRIIVRFSRIILPEPGKITSKYVLRYLDAALHLKTMATRVNADQTEHFEVNYAGNTPGPECVKFSNLLKTTFDATLSAAQCGAWIGDAAACSKKIGEDLAAAAAKYFGAAPQCPLALGAPLVQDYVDASMDLKVVTATSSISNSALVRYGFGLAFGYIARINLEADHPRAQIQNGNIVTNSFTRSLSMAAVTLTPWGYDSQTHTPSLRERARFFIGPVLTPYYGLAGGFAFEINRYLAVNTGYARLWFDTPKSGETLGQPPTALNRAEPFDLRSTGACFIGLSYNLK